ncbi:hypothetical protein A9Q83_00080 [Alphaproteobacteria bacterium 46_93_T64]|nr:hypothetical protein A9Q83_00080 [Alphaproteobacteria bacterium 46_93_T64]
MQSVDKIVSSRLFKDPLQESIISKIEMRSGSSWLITLGYVFIISLIYYSLARLGLSLQFEQSQATPIWPPSGFAFAICLLLGQRALPGIAFGAIAANLADFYFKSEADIEFSEYLSRHPAEIIVCISIGIGNTLEAFAGLYLVNRFVPKNTLFKSIKSVVVFVCISLAICTISACIGVLSLAISGILPDFLWSSVWFTWWLGDTAGILIFTPAIYVWLAMPVRELRKELSPTMVLGLIGLSLFGAITFLELGNLSYLSAQAYLLIPVLFAIVFVTGVGTATLAILIISALSILGTINELGPFVRGNQNTSLSLLQGFVSVISITLLLLDSALRERRDALENLKRTHDELEDRVKDRTHQLETANRYLAQSNKELDDFADIATNDLKKPIREIDNQIANILEDYGGKLDRTVVNRIEKLTEILRRLETLISTLLHFSRVGRRDLLIEEADLQSSVQMVLTSLKTRLDELDIVVRIPATLPRFKCDNARVGEVFRNLITNAMKYNDKAEKWVEIGYEQNGPNTKFYVKDNGIGIEDDNKGKIFTIFKRLHGENQYGGGTGAGMTIVKKIVELHGGRVWVESKVGVGSTFYFTLKKDERLIR